MERTRDLALAFAATLGLLLLAGIDIASNARPVGWSEAVLALAGLAPVLAFALVAFASRSRLA